MGDGIPHKIEVGLERSRLESGTFRFRDPLNQQRRFIPVRLDAAPVRGSLAQFVCVDWRPAAREAEYGKLLEACRIASRAPLEGTDAQRAFQAKIISLDRKSVV